VTDKFRVALAAASAAVLPANPTRSGTKLGNRIPFKRLTNVMCEIILILIILITNDQDVVKDFLGST